MIIEENLNRDNIENEFNEDENEYLSDLDEDFYEYYLCNESFGINYESNSIKKFNIYFHLAFNRDKKYIIYISTESFIINNTHVSELIEFIVHRINNANISIKYENIDYLISLKDTEENDEKEKFEFYNNNYEIKSYDYLTRNNTHSYCSTDLLKSINEENIILSSKDELNILIRKKF